MRSGLREQASCGSNTWGNTTVLEWLLDGSGRKSHGSAAFAPSDCSNRLLTPPPLRVNGVSKTSYGAKAAVDGWNNKCGGGAGRGGYGPI